MPDRSTWNNILYASGSVENNAYSMRQISEMLRMCVPENFDQYSDHISKLIAVLIDRRDLSAYLQPKLDLLAKMLPHFILTIFPGLLHLYRLVELCFDPMIRLASLSKTDMVLSASTMQLLKAIVTSLNYWELFNLLQLKPTLHQFLALINYDMMDCYQRFMRDYHKFTYVPIKFSSANIAVALRHKARHKHQLQHFRNLSESLSGDEEEEEDGQDQAGSDQEDDDKGKNRKRLRSDDDDLGSSSRKFDLRSQFSRKSSNYDPEIVHECQLPLPEEPDKMCLRRFARKYELTRHQETVHSKKKKLFKCFVCVKQDPAIGPRIFTRHDTLAKHIRVNHRISGKEAKAEVAYSKKHAEIVDGDITVHVGRRKTKVNFELRAHMERKAMERGENPEGIVFDDIDSDYGSGSLDDDLDDES